MSYHGLSMWNGSSKIHYFIDIWNSFCWRPWRPWMLLSTKLKGHKSNFRISEMYRFCFYDLKVHFWWPNKSSKHQVLSVNTLYVGCPTSYSCHVDSVLLYSKFEAKRIKYWNSKFKYLQIRYSSIPRRTWLFQIFLRDIRDIRETDFNV